MDSQQYQGRRIFGKDRRTPPGKIVAADRLRPRTRGECRAVARIHLKPAREVQAQALDAGNHWATVRRAKDAVGVEIFKDGFGPLGVWTWRLKDAQPPLAKMSSEDLSQDPHVAGIPAKALTEQDRQEGSEHCMLREDVDPVDALWRCRRRCFHAVILARCPQRNQYDRLCASMLAATTGIALSC
jgi:hypothetical protein